ncbi:MAG TPA: hypothetical protein VF661_16830 [Actinomycetales bacterium]|jgi:hypothetical protein
MPSPSAADVPAARRPTYGTWLALSACAYAVLHHIGSLPGGLGEAPGPTRWVDWLDLAVPYLVLAPVVGTLVAARATVRAALVAAVGAVAYTSGHGIHLAANSIANAAPSPTAHLWDEPVGHAIWYAGAAAMGAALTTTMTGRARPRSPLAHVVAVAVGLTWFTNALGSGLALPALVLATIAVVHGWRHREGLALVLLVGFAPAVPLLALASLGLVGGS